MKRRFASLLVLLGVLANARPAIAQAASTSDEARELYAQGKAEYQRLNYAAALSLFEQSYALTHATALLFDIAQAHRLAGTGHCAASRRYYKSYLELEPDAENQREVSERMDEIAACAEAEDRAAAERARRTAARPAPALAPAVAARPASPRGGPHTAAVLTTGVGAALLLSGAVLYLRARQRFNEAERACPCPEGSFSDWQNLTRLSYGLMVAGGAGVALGGTFWVLSVNHGNARGPSAFLAVDGRF